MERRSKKLKSFEGKDRLSDMPDQILVHILSFLPTEDAVRTMLLSRFGNLWTLLPSLGFLYFRYWRRRPSYEPRTLDAQNFAKFCLFVRNVLMLHKRPNIDKFSLEFEIDEKHTKLGDDVKMWLKFALDREVKRLHLNATCGSSVVEESILPVLTSHTLVKLKLSGCTIERQHQVHLGSLKELTLSYVNVSDEAFEDLITGCPSLRDLFAENPFDIKKWCFTNSSIQHLDLSLTCEGDGFQDNAILLDCPNLRYLDLQISGTFVPEVIDVSSIREVNINTFYYNDYDDHGIKLFMEKIKDTKVLRLSNYEPELLSIIRNMDLPKNRWKHVDLDLVIDEESFSGIFKLLRSSPHMERLTLNVTGDSEYRGNMLSPELYTPCMMPRLKTISMHGYGEAVEGELQLLEFLLKSAVVLDKLSIIPGKQQLTPVKEFEFVKQLSNFPRAAANARIVFA